MPVVFCCSLRCRIAVYVVVQSWIGFLMYGFISRWKIVCLKENMTTALSKYLQMKSCQVGFSRRINCTIWKRSPCITFSRKKPEKTCSKFLAYKNLNGYSILFPWSNFFAFKHHVILTPFFPSKEYLIQCQCNLTQLIESLRENRFLLSFVDTLTSRTVFCCYFSPLCCTTSSLRHIISIWFYVV